MKTLKYLLQKEFLQIFRSKVMLGMIIAMPTIQLLIMPWALTYEQRNISLCVVDNAHDEMSRQLIEKIKSSGYFRLTGYTDSYSEALQDVEDNTSDLILELPRNFERNILRERRIDFMLSINALNGMKAGLGMSYLTQISNDYVRSALPPQAMTAMKQIPQIELKPYYRYNPKLKYYPFMVPGIFVILLTVMTGILSSQNIVREKEVGTIEQLNVTPISKTVFILGKIIPFWIIGFVVLTIGMIVAWLMYDVYPMGSILTIYAFAAIYIVAFTGLGIVISNYANTQQQAMLLTFFFLMICIMFSGLFAPVSSMPDWMQRVAMCNPLRYFVEVIRMVYLKGAGIGDIVPQMLKECCFVLLFNIWAVLSYKKTS